MKNKKLTLDNVVVKSFITTLDENKSRTIDGGVKSANTCFPSDGQHGFCPTEWNPTACSIIPTLTGDGDPIEPKGPPRKVNQPPRIVVSYLGGCNTVPFTWPMC